MAGELILIVEDNEKNRKLERDVLQFHGYRIDGGGDGGGRAALGRRERRPRSSSWTSSSPASSGIEALRPAPRRLRRPGPSR